MVSRKKLSVMWTLWGMELKHPTSLYDISVKYSLIQKFPKIETGEIYLCLIRRKRKRNYVYSLKLYLYFNCFLKLKK